jgi:hypothetical protein
MIKETIFFAGAYRTPLRGGGLANRVRRADSAMREGLICTSGSTRSTKITRR